jgi:phage-related protein
MTVSTNGGLVTISGDGVATWTGNTPITIGGQPVWTPPVAPDPPVMMDETPAANRFSFGDGYSQDAPRGLNSIPSKVTISFSNLYTSDKDAILQFLRARKGVEPFWWQQPNEQMRRWVSPSWNVEQQGWDRWRVTARIERSVKPGT